MQSEQFLTTEVKYIHIANGEKPWEGNWTQARVEPESGNDDQQWTYEINAVTKTKLQPSNVIRHTFDGRVMDIAWWKFQQG